LKNRRGRFETLAREVLESGVRLKGRVGEGWRGGGGGLILIGGIGVCLSPIVLASVVGLSLKSSGVAATYSSRAASRTFCFVAIHMLRVLAIYVIEGCASSDVAKCMVFVVNIMVA